MGACPGRSKASLLTELLVGGDTGGEDQPPPECMQIALLSYPVGEVRGNRTKPTQHDHYDLGLALRPSPRSSPHGVLPLATR